jgi:manganese transport protein
MAMGKVGEVTALRRSLDDVHGSVGVPHRNMSWLKRLFVFLGPAYLVSVGYMDPGNWATDLEGGARFGYALIWVLLMSNLMAVLLQTLSARLGVVTGHDLAQACRAEYSRSVARTLWVLAEVAIAATDLAEVLGTIIALKLLFRMPMIWGCAITVLDTFLLLALQRVGIRKLEAVILTLVATIGACFLFQIAIAQPDLSQIARGFWPSLPIDETGTSKRSLFVAIGILGATVMPHNLYLHSALVQSRKIAADRHSREQACRYNLVDSAIALNAAFFVNASILVLAGTTFYNQSIAPVDSIEKAHELLPRFLGPVAPWLFGVALLCAGQSSTLTGTLAGQIVMEGFLRLRIAPWLRRLVTRLIALVPAVIVLLTVGEGGTQHLLVLSQVILSLQLSFAVIPLIHFTSNRMNMGDFVNPGWVRVLCWLTAAIIVGLNAKLIYDKVSEWIPELLRLGTGTVTGPAWLPWAARAGTGGLVFLLAGTAFLLVWVTVKPLFRPSNVWSGAPPVELDWSDALRPRPVGSIGLALEHSAGDAEIVSRALGLAREGATRLVVLHVSDTPLTGLYGPDTGDLHTEADARYLADVVSVMRLRGFLAEPVLLYDMDRAGALVSYLRRHPVDLLVVGSHGHRMVADLLFGQTVDRVRHRLEIPMLIARPGSSAVEPAAVPGGAAELDAAGPSLTGA